MTPKVSIVVPVYNAGEFLQRCIDSLINQTLNEIEIILILDVPTDGSDKVAETYAKQDNRIKLVYNKTNLHIGFSRNEGLKIAQGEYIGFADHDDYCEPYMFEKLYNTAIKSSADVVVSNYYDESPIESSYFGFPTGFSDNEFQKFTFNALISAKYSHKNTNSFDNTNVIWNQVFKNEFLKNNDIYFNDNKVLTMEDVLFNIKVHYFAKKVVYLPETFYHHINNHQNAYDNYDYRAISKVIPHLEAVDLFLRDNNIWQQFKSEFAECVLKRLYSSYLHEVKFKSIFRSFNFFKYTRDNRTIQDTLGIFDKNKKLLKKFSITKRSFLYIVRNKMV